MFEAAEGLQAVARGVYALLRSPLLSPRPDSHPDAPVAAAHLWAALPPEELQRCIYPILSSYTDPDTLVRVSPPFVHHSVRVCVHVCVRVRMCVYVRCVHACMHASVGLTETCMAFMLTCLLFFVLHILLV